MGKIETLNEYIEECDNFIEDNDPFHDEERFDLFRKIQAVYGEEIPGFNIGLNFYENDYSDGVTTIFGSDIEKIKAKLINYKDNLEIEKEKRELELAKLKQGNINVSANACNSNNININISLEQTIENIKQIPDDIMTKSEKEDLEDKLSGIDVAVKSGKKEKAKEKIYGVLKFLVDKGVDVLVVLLPYLGQMAGMIDKM